MNTEQDKKFIKGAISLARESVKKGGFPAGALVIKDGVVIAQGLSLGEVLHDPTAHAETTAIREACKALKMTNLEGATLYESLQCCTMCFSVANWAGISRIVTGCRKTQEMVQKHYYEGVTNVQELNRLNNRKMELDYILDFEKESLDIIKEWEEKNKQLNDA